MLQWQERIRSEQSSGRQLSQPSINQQCDIRSTCLTCAGNLKLEMFYYFYNVPNNIELLSKTLSTFCSCILEYLHTLTDVAGDAAERRARPHAPAAPAAL